MISSSTGSITSIVQVVIKYDEVDDVRWCWWQVDRKVVKKLKIGKKVQKASKILKICKSHWFGKTFTKVPILYQFTDTKNSSFRSSSDSFLSYFLLGSESFSIPYWEQLLSKQRVADALTYFSPEEPIFIPSFFVCKLHVFPLLLQFWRCAPKEDIPAQG